MPMTMELSSTPGGRKVVRSVASGLVDEKDAHYYQQVFQVGGTYYGVPLLGILEKDTSFSVESRKVFTDASPVKIAALVVSSAPVKVMLNFMMKASQLAGRMEAGSETRFFSSEAEAVAWIDQKVAGTA